MSRAVVSGTRFKSVLGVLALITVWSLACGGGNDVNPGDPAPVGGDAPEDRAAQSGVQLDGTWQIRPVDEELRHMKVISAALSKGGKARDRLGEMSRDEQNLFREWKQKKGDEVTQMKLQLKFMKNCKFVFAGGQVTVHFDMETHGPTPYMLVSFSNQSTVITFDPGLENGVETHHIEWSSKDKGTNNITGANGSSFIPLVIKRMN